ncbi:PREDICTED: coiled-coil domain-containing protein 92 [Gavialis gangeticus]|uniref:coiled-coil domain-containing protein 92 n=1 Tax=Gavialis gangeticus TaxID=94835 RepID=UPI00092EC553|nr:PREDICTED: coiled-coil domain-containing protein 92 [Gavialis gangeticus]
MTPSSCQQVPPLFPQAWTVNFVAMETVSLEHQIQSVQRHIAFLKKEQMELLRDLHLEILRLQKHCSELTHDLEMKELEARRQEVIDRELEDKCKIMEAQLHEKEKDNLDLRKELRHKEALVAALRSNLRNKERKFLEELKRRSHRVTILNTELQKQTEAAAYLSFQLHSTKQTLHSSQQSGKPPSDRPLDKPLPTQPSGEVKPKKRSHKAHVRRLVTDCSFSKGVMKDSFQRERMSSFEDTDPMPDPALFLYTRRHHAPHRQKSEPKTEGLKKAGADPNDSAATSSGLQRPFQQLSQEQVEATSPRSSAKTKPSRGKQGRCHGSSPSTPKDSE